MPTLLTKPISNTVSIAVWQITETEEFFYSSLRLSCEDTERIRHCKMQKVRLQKLACRAALAELLGTKEINITYLKTGQPQIENHSISFSHTEKTVAVACAKIPVGIDIEEMKPRILSLYPRFMSEKEIEMCNINNLSELYYIWCAKEAMYKWFAKKNVDFISDLFVNNNKGVICNHLSVNLTPMVIDPFMMVVCSSESNI